MSGRVQSTGVWRWPLAASLALLRVFAACDDDDGDGAPVTDWAPAYRLSLVEFDD